MDQTIPPLRGDAVQDERQLDGSRHLTVDMADPSGSWFCSLHCVVDREGTLREAELELETPDGPWSGDLDVVDRLSVAGPLRLLATFVDAGHRITVELQGDEESGYIASLS